MATRILLSTTVTWPAAARLAGAFASCGASVEAFAPRRHPIADSSVLDKLYPYRPLQALSGLREVLETANPDIVLPCDDRATRHLVALAKEDARFADIVACSLGRIGSYETLFSRNVFLNEAAALGIDVPVTREVATEADLKAALHVTGLPVVLKSDGSWGGDGVSFAQNYDEALSAFRHMALAPSRLRSLARAAKRQDAHFLMQAVEPQDYAISVQRFVDGTPATCAFAAWNGEVLANLCMDVMQTVKHAGPATVLRRAVSPEMDEAARRIAHRFALSGFHGLDFMRDKLGKLHLIEINPRATQICHLALGARHDLPAALIGALEGKPAKPRVAVTSAELIALFPQSQGLHVAGAYHDIPADDPKLLHALSAHRADASAALQNA